MENIPYQTIDCTGIEREEHGGETGSSYWQTIQMEGLRIRLIEYTKGYLANHWCQKGHIVHCLEGIFISELETGEQFIMNPGMSYIVSDDMSSHRSRTETGAKLLIVDGDFLQYQPEEPSAI